MWLPKVLFFSRDSRGCAGAMYNLHTHVYRDDVGLRSEV